MSYIGPKLPSSTREKSTAQDTSLCPTEITADATIGPPLPHHLNRNLQESNDFDGKDNVFGPQLPPHFKSTTISGTLPSNSNDLTKTRENQEDGGVHGPSLPPHLLNRFPLSSSESSHSTRILGPELPPNFKMQDNSDTDSSEDDSYGPDPRLMANDRMKQDIGVNSWIHRNQSKLEEDQTIQRETWMLELPPEIAAIQGLAPRKFRAKPAPVIGDRSIWTDTPADAARKKNEPPKQDEKEVMRKQLIVERDLAMEEMAKKAEKKLKRKESLMEMHEKKLKKKAKKEEKERDGQPPERKRFNREEDLKVNKFDDAQKKAIVKRAQLLNDRFSQGENFKMSDKQLGGSSDGTEALLKKLSSTLFQNNADVANAMYGVMRELLLGNPSSQRLARQPNSPKTGAFERGSRDRRNETEAYMLDKRRIKEYLETINPAHSKEFSDLCERVQFDRSLLLEERISSLRFLMQMGKRYHSEQPILERKISLDLRQIRTLITKPKKPPESTDSSDQSRHSSSDGKSSSPSGRSTSSKQLNGTLKSTQSGLESNAYQHNSRIKDIRGTDIIGGLTDKDLFEGLLFAWQGIAGKVFRRCEATRNYYLHDQWKVGLSVREQADDLAAMGQLHDSLLPFTDPPSNTGRIRNCLAGYVRDSLSAYYNLIASIQTEIQRKLDSTAKLTNENLTLEWFHLQSAVVMRTFMHLNSILEFTREQKGGYLASGVYCFIHHGDPELQSLVKTILVEICQPLYDMLARWLLEGTISDYAGEFFIAVDNHVAGNRLWLEKYSIRTAMLPEFIPVQLAEKALCVGRNINFLRETCEDEQPFAEREKIRELLQSRSVEVIYLMEKREELENLIEHTYQETNKRVLQVLLSKYSMLEHFQAHRKFLLLGQGDFTHHLMDLLIEVLNKPASQLHPHYLNGVLESAVRATTAQFEPEDIINRLDAATMAHSAGDVGWDVFYLRYHVDGPIGTVFSPSSEIYQLLFFALWRAKRMEMLLSKSWKLQITSAKGLRRIGELGPVLRICHELTAEMVHLMRQMQYYFLFEVLECAWNELVIQVTDAISLDAVISAHQQFLLRVAAGVFKDEAHQKLDTQLRVVYDLVLQLETKVSDVLTAGEREARERSKLKEPTPIVDSDKVMFLKKRRDFVTKFVPACSSQLKLLEKTYRDTVKNLLLMLNSQDDLNLQLLSVRLDFNEYYKKNDSRLEAPLTFQHRRLSSASNELSPLLGRKILMASRSEGTKRN